MHSSVFKQLESDTQNIICTSRTETIHFVFYKCTLQKYIHVHTCSQLNVTIWTSLNIVS